MITLPLLSSTPSPYSLHWLPASMISTKPTEVNHMNFLLMLFFNCHLFFVCISTDKKPQPSSYITSLVHPYIVGFVFWRQFGCKKYNLPEPECLRALLTSLTQVEQLFIKKSHSNPLESIEKNLLLQ